MNQADVIETTAEVVPIIPTEQLAEINATDQNLAKLRAEAMELATLGVPQTKEQYKRVHDLTMVCVNVRTSSDKLSDELAKPYRDKAQAIRAEGKRIGDHAKQSEDIVRPLKKQYEAEQERLKIEAEKAAAAKIQGRVDSIVKLGFAFDGAGYHAEAYDRFIDSVEVHALPDDLWQELYDEMLGLYEEHQAVLKQQREQAEAEAKQQEEERQKEAARQEQERQKEADRLRKLAEEQQAKEKELADARAKFEKEQADFRAEQQRVAKIQADAVRAVRVAKLTAVGFVEAADKYLTFAGTDWYFSPVELENLTDDQVDQAVQSAVRMNEQRQAKIVADEEQRVADTKAAADEAKAKQKADKERTARLKGDKGELAKWVGSITKLTLGRALPDMTQPETKQLLDELKHDLLAVAKRYMDKVTAL